MLETVIMIAIMEMILSTSMIISFSLSKFVYLTSVVNSQCQ